MSDEQTVEPGDGPRAPEIRRRLKAAAVWRSRAEAAPSAERRADCLREADKLLLDARQLLKDDEDAAELARKVRRGGGAYFPTDDGGSGGPEPIW